MRKRNVIAAAAVSAGLLAGAGTAYAGTAPVNWQAQTCRAAIAYTQHPTQAGLAAVLADAGHYGQQLLSGPVVRSYKAADVLDMLATERSPSRNAPRYLPRDVRYLAQDCLS